MSNKESGSMMFVVFVLGTIPTFIGHYGPLIAWSVICLCYVIDNRNKP